MQLCTVLCNLLTDPAPDFPFWKSEFKMYSHTARMRMESSLYHCSLLIRLHNAVLTRWAFPTLRCHPLYALCSYRAPFSRPTVSCAMFPRVLTTAGNSSPSELWSCQSIMTSQTICRSLITASFCLSLARLSLELSFRAELPGIIRSYTFVLYSLDPRAFLPSCVQPSMVSHVVCGSEQIQWLVEYVSMY